VGDVLVGTTPTTFKTARTNDPVEFTFRVQGFEAEKIRALPTQGLTISARFSTPGGDQGFVVHKAQRRKAHRERARRLIGRHPNRALATYP
jgi:hypothetical protein